MSPLAVDQARTQGTSDSLNVVAARAHYQAAAQMAAYLRLTAPFAGTITERNAAPGAMVGQSAGLPLFKLRQLNPLRLRVAVPEAYVGEIKNGNPVQFTVRAFPGRTFTGKLTRMAGSVQAATRSEQVELDIPNPKEELTPGMFASASLPVKVAANSLFVPKSAVVSTAERTYLIRVCSLARRVRCKASRSDSGSWGHEVEDNIKKAAFDTKTGSKPRWVESFPPRSKQGCLP